MLGPKKIWQPWSRAAFISYSLDVRSKNLARSQSQVSRPEFAVADTCRRRSVGSNRRESENGGRLISSSSFFCFARELCLHSVYGGGRELAGHGVVDVRSREGGEGVSVAAAVDVRQV
jgi:hypothetical protein